MEALKKNSIKEVDNVLVEIEKLVPLDKIPEADKPEQAKARLLLEKEKERLSIITNLHTKFGI